MTKVWSRICPQTFPCPNALAISGSRTRCGMMESTRLPPIFSMLLPSYCLLEATDVLDATVERIPYTGMDQANHVARTPALTPEIQASSRQLAGRLGKTKIREFQGHK